MFKPIKVLLILVLIFILIIAFSRNALCRFLIQSATNKATGLQLSIEELNLDVLKSNLYIQGITLFNPEGFKDKILGKAKEVFIKYDLWASLSGRLHFSYVRIDISEINIIRNEKGSSNMAAFKKKRIETKPATEITPTSSFLFQRKTKTGAAKVRPKLLIDSLELSVKRVAFVDYTAEAEEPAMIVFASSDPFVFKNVSDLNYVIDSVSTKGGFRNLLNTIVGLIPQDVLKNTTEVIKKKIQEALPKAR